MVKADLAELREMLARMDRRTDVAIALSLAMKQDSVSWEEVYSLLVQRGKKDKQYALERRARAALAGVVALRQPGVHWQRDEEKGVVLVWLAK